MISDFAEMNDYNYHPNRIGVMRPNINDIDDVTEIQLQEIYDLVIKTREYTNGGHKLVRKKVLEKKQESKS